MSVLDCSLDDTVPTGQHCNVSVHKQRSEDSYVDEQQPVLEDDLATDKSTVGQYFKVFMCTC